MEARSSLLDMKIDRNVPLAIYYQISERIRRDIAQRRLKPGEQLPAVRQIAELCEVSPFTVKHAYDDLVREGILVSRAGAGTFVAPPVPPAIEVVVPFNEQQDFFPYKDFLRQIFLQAKEEFKGESRRCFMSHITVEHSSADEILSVCRARRVEGLIVYRPCGILASEMRMVSEKTPTVSLVYPIDSDSADCVAIDPREPMRRIIEKRLNEGKREFVFVGMRNLVGSEMGDRSPYWAIIRAFKEILHGRGIEPGEYIIDRGNIDAGKVRETLKRTIPEESVVLTSYPGVIEELPFPEDRSLDFISYTEYHESLGRFMGRVSMLYAGIELCTRAAIGLLRERIAKPGMPARTVNIEPETFEAQACAARKGGAHAL